MLKGIWMKMAVAAFALFGLFTVGDATLELAQADQCVQQCRSDHNQCRISKKGSPSCDSQLQACMDSCRTQR
jgi:hypothetical protein